MESRPGSTRTAYREGGVAPPRWPFQRAGCDRWRGRPAGRGSRRASQRGRARQRTSPGRKASTLSAWRLGPALTVTLARSWMDRQARIFGGKTCLGRTAPTLDSLHLSLSIFLSLSIYIYLSRTSVGGEPGKDPVHRSRRRRRSRSSRGARAPGRWRLAVARRRTARGRHRAR